MDLQTYLNNAINTKRMNKMETSDQLTVGEILLKIEPLLKKQKEIKEKYGHTARVFYDFCNLFPCDINSWRGSYSELALNYKSYNESEPLEITDFYNMLKETIGKTFGGYKGGEYIMGKNTPVWVANYGDSGNTAVIDIVNDEYQIIIITGYREF